MKIYNTLSRKIEAFQSLNPPEVKMYLCGPTVYDFAHIGHSRTYTNSDILIRILKWLRFEVNSVMNITDVGHLVSDNDTGEDKMEKKAKKESKDIKEIAKFYTKDFWEMTDKLNIQRPETVTPATEYILEMIALVKKLEKKGFTYKTKDGIYFDTSKFKNYGKLGRIDVEGLKAGWRIDKGEKKNPTDFALWKFSPKDEKRQMEWESPWAPPGVRGKVFGFPGWHIECSAMSMKILGESLDIHTGGIDHIPVHHTNEICQSEAATGKQFVKYWFHSNFLDINGEKMSKSLGNYLRVKDIEDKGFEPLALRYLFLTGHYRTKMNFTWKSLEGASEAYKKLKVMIGDWDKEEGLIDEEFNQKFKMAVENDLNMPQALATVWEMAKSDIPNGNKLALIKDWDKILGLDLLTIKKIPEAILQLIKQREELRKDKKWQEADELRKEIEAKGFTVKDVKIKT